MTPSLVRRCETELGLQIAVGYGMTENTCGTFLVPHGSNEDVTVNTVGRALPGPGFGKLPDISIFWFVF